MAEYGGDHEGRHRSQFICVDAVLKPANGSSTKNHDGLVLYFVEGRCGSLHVLHMIRQENYHVQYALIDALRDIFHK